MLKYVLSVLVKTNKTDTLYRLPRSTGGEKKRQRKKE